MGWWTDTDNPEITLGDVTLDITKQYIENFCAEYQEAFGRKPSIGELQKTLEISLITCANDDTIADFDEKAVKSVVIKTGKALKRQKVKPGDLFAFRLNAKEYGFGRILAKNPFGFTAEIFDYFSAHPRFNPGQCQRLIKPVVLNTLTLFERRAQGEWLVIGHDMDWDESRLTNEICFTYGHPPVQPTYVDVRGNKVIVDGIVKNVPRYSPVFDEDVKYLVNFARGLIPKDEALKHGVDINFLLT